MELVLINGPCGVGKSTTGSLLAEKLLFSQLIRTDDLRQYIPDGLFADPLGRSEDMARMWQVNRLGQEIAEAALAQGRTVIVDSIKYQTDWIRPWEELGSAMGATVIDVCLTAPKSVVEERARERGFRPEGRLTPENVSLLYDKVQAFYRNRPDALVIDNSTLTPNDAMGLILERINELAYPDETVASG